MKNKYCIIKTTFSGKMNAKKMAKLLLKERLIACAQIDEIDSIFSWENKISNQKEFNLSMKTISSNYKKIEKLILKNHSYKVPQIIQIPIQNGFDDYLSWIDEVLKRK